MAGVGARRAARSATDPTVRGGCRHDAARCAAHLIGSSPRTRRSHGRRARIEAQRQDDRDDDRHPGTNDLDVGLALALLYDQRYAELSARLHAEGFEPDTNANDNPTLQRWRIGNLNVTVDFLMPPAPDQDQARRVQALQPDFGALVTPGLELAFDERVEVDLDGHTLKGERARRTIPVCGPALFVVLKALAFGDRGEPKDALRPRLRHPPHTRARAPSPSASPPTPSATHRSSSARCATWPATSTDLTDSAPPEPPASRSPSPPGGESWTMRLPMRRATSTTSCARRGSPAGR